MFTSLALALLPSHASPIEINALSKATEAAYIQSGLASHVKNVQDGAASFAKHEANRLGVAPYVATLGGGYQLYRSQTLTLKTSSRSVLTVRLDSAFVTFTF